MSKPRRIVAGSSRNVGAVEVTFTKAAHSKHFPIWVGRKGKSRIAGRPTPCSDALDAALREWRASPPGRTFTLDWPTRHDAARRRPAKGSRALEGLHQV
jgi:hypothetical protein